MRLIHQDNGTGKDVSDRLVAKRAEAVAGADRRAQALVDASIGAVQTMLRGVPPDVQATITAQVEERTENGKLIVSQLYVDVTLIPAPGGDAAPIDPEPAPAVPNVAQQESLTASDVAPIPGSAPVE